MRSAAWMIGIVAVAAGVPAYAESDRIDVPAGSAASAAVAIARQTGTSVVISDSEIAQRRVQAISGTFTAGEAVARLARAAGARAISAGPGAWRIVPAAQAPTPPRQSRPPAQQPAPAPPPPPPPPPQPIIVIASKQEVPLGQYPGHVELIDGQALTFGGVGGTEKIMQRVPTVSSTHLGTGRNKLFIRGIADSSFTGPTQSTVGQYLGDLRLSYNAPDPDLRLSDLARVEVLEGPQGTLYGAGSLGGILRLVPNDPEMGHFAASTMVGGSAIQHGALGADASATVNLPLLSDVAALRVTVNAETQGGYIDKPAMGDHDVNRTDILSGRATARVKLGGGWTVDLVGIAQQTDGRDSQYADRDGPPLSRSSAVTEGFDAEYAQGQMVVTGWLGDVRFKTSTGITGQELEERYDATPPGGDPRLFIQHNDTEMIANETRIWQPMENSFGWLLGASYTHNRTELTRALGQPIAVARATASTLQLENLELMPSEAVASLPLADGLRNDVKEITGYGEASLRLADGLVATAGARYTRTRLGGTGADFRRQAMIATLADTETSRTEEVFLPSASLAATVIPDTMLYMRYQEGFRPGGLAIAGDYVIRFRNDRIATFEIGGRHGSANAPFDLAASVSHTRWRDIQADFIDDVGLPSTANIGDGNIWTATLTGGVSVTPELRLSAGVTYNDSRIDEPMPMFTSRISQVPNIARFAGRIGFDYVRPVGNSLELSAQGWAHYVGKSRLGVGPELGELQGDYLDTGLTLRLGRDNLGLTLGLTNLTDEEGNRFALGTPFAVGRDQITPLRPRTIRIGLDAAF